MQIKVKCPECGKSISIIAEHAAWTVRCRSCAHRFVPVEDVGVSCPECGSVVLMSLESPRQEISCLSCGFVLAKPGLRLSPRLLWSLAGAAVLVILLIVVISAISNMVPRRVYANEASAIANLRTFSAAEMLFNRRFGRYVTLGQLANTGYIDGSLAVATSRRRAKSGYYFTLTAGANTWSCTAMPAVPGKTGTRSFYIDQTGAIRYADCKSNTDPPANANSKLLGAR